MSPDINVKPFRDRHVVIIGAGMGGLAAAVDLAATGLRVTVLERAAAAGGKMRETPVGGRAIDSGPTVFTMRWAFDALFGHAGAHLEDHVTLHPATTLARHAWAGGQVLDLFADRARSADAIGAFAGPREAAGYLGFCKEAARIYRTLEGPFIRAARPSMAGLAAAAGPVAALRLRPFDTLWSALGSHFRDPRLRQLFGRYSTYCGTSPFQATATLMLVAHVEQEGVWLIEGGMQRLAEALVALATRHGVQFRYGAHVAEILTDGGAATGVRLAGGEVLAADAVVMNGEPAALAAGLLGEPARDPSLALPPPRRSLSALTWAGVAHTDGLPLLRHSLFFSAAYRREFDEIAAGRLPAEPTVYVCAQDRSDTDGPAPDGPERLLVLVNAPANGDDHAFTEQETERCMQGISGLLARCGLEMRFTAPPVVTGPAAFHRFFPASAGALYGPAVIGSQASFRRPASRTALPRLYLAGGSAHPGAGVPMAALSGRQAAASVMADLFPPHPGSMRRWRRAAMPGGMSTR